MRSLVPLNTSIDFIKLFPYALVVSVTLIGISLVTWFDRGEGKFGIDYVGGHELIVSFNSPTDVEKLRAEFERGGLPNALIQAFEAESGDYSIRVAARTEGNTAAEISEVQGEIRRVLDQSFAGQYEVLQADFVGPTIGAELKRRALVAVMIGLIGILIYVTARFEFSFALGAIVALFHDVIIATGIYLFAGHEINGAVLAAVLTIIGYSVNDTIVIFDRAREERKKDEKGDLGVIFNRANNACLSRTIITTLLTLFTAVALNVFGGGAIADLSLFLVVGVITGAFSTIFVATPFALMWERWRERRVRAAQAAA